MLLPRRTIFLASGAVTPGAFAFLGPPLGHLALFGLPCDKGLNVRYAPNRTPGSKPNATGQQAQLDVAPKSCTANTQNCGTFASANQTTTGNNRRLCVEYYDEIPFLKKFPPSYFAKLGVCTKSKPRGGFGKLKGDLTLFLTFEGFMSL